MGQEWDQTFHHLWITSSSITMMIKGFQKQTKKTLKQPKNLKVFSDDLAVINDGGKFEPGKHSPWWRRVEDALKTSFVTATRLEVKTT